MNREIKFRAWNKTTKEFEPAFSIYDIKDDYWDNNTANKVFLQFTGLHDRNGTEIYEGDILREYEQVVDPWRNDNSKDYTQDQLHQVRYLTGNNNDGFRCVSQPTEYYTGDNYYTTWINPKTMTVIGNIYENSELLK